MSRSCARAMIAVYEPDFQGRMLDVRVDGAVDRGDLTPVLGLGRVTLPPQDRRGV